MRRLTLFCTSHRLSKTIFLLQQYCRTLVSGTKQPKVYPVHLHYTRDKVSTSFAYATFESESMVI